MRRRTWDAKTKVMIVLEGLKGKPVAELCTEHQISQAQYYRWRDQFLAHAPKAFEVHEQSQREARLARENARLNTRVGELTLDDVSGDRLHGNWRGMPGAVPLPLSDNHTLSETRPGRHGYWRGSRISK
jgi:transposase-like protein